MSKYSYQFKVNAVQEYFNKSHNYSVACRQFGMRSWKELRTWVHEVQSHGYDILAPQKGHHSYSFDCKLQVVH